MAVVVVLSLLLLLLLLVVVVAAVVVVVVVAVVVVAVVVVVVVVVVVDTVPLPSPIKLRQILSFGQEQPPPHPSFPFSPLSSRSWPRAPCRTQSPTLGLQAFPQTPRPRGQTAARDKSGGWHE
jgi:hypothetical protein